MVLLFGGGMRENGKRERAKRGLAVSLFLFFPFSPLTVIL
jgi:hypothetical protein